MTREHDLINRYFAPLCSNPDEAPAFGLLDDTALLQPTRGKELLVTMDTLVANLHFFANDSPASIAQKALAVNVSDIIAKGGLPHSYLLSLALPDHNDENLSIETWLMVFAKALALAQKKFGCVLIGGDTVATKGPLVVSITLLGQVDAGRMVPRRGASVGDIVFVSGTIGDAALGLLLRNKEEDQRFVAVSSRHKLDLLDLYFRPEPPVQLAPLLAQYASAAMDISDGLAGDFDKLCAASVVGGQIEAAAVPLSDATTSVLAKTPDLIKTVLTGGDDYQVLATIPADKADEFEKKAGNVTRIGKILSLEKSVAILDKNGIPLDLPQGAFDHFAAQGE